VIGWFAQGRSHWPSDRRKVVLMVGWMAVRGRDGDERGGLVTVGPPDEAG
jgi:hypothetical protein